jgi:hypothetical protein
VENVTTSLSSAAGTVAFQNCLLEKGQLILSPSSSGTWNFTETLFDQTPITQSGANGAISGNYNGYISGSSRLSPNGANDLVFPSVVFSQGPLGSYYLPVGSPLIDAFGPSRTAAADGLYHYTTLVSQAKEAITPLDLGLHYIALDPNGVPQDANGDGIPDYIQDANGNGVVDPGESSWLVSINGLSAASPLMVFTPLKN